MGDASDMADIRRFMRSPEGNEHLNELRGRLVSRTIIGVEFWNEGHSVGLEISFEDGTTFDCQEVELDIDRLRSEFSQVLQREYYTDFPERREVETAAVLP